MTFTNGVKKHNILHSLWLPIVVLIIGVIITLFVSKIVYPDTDNVDSLRAGALSLLLTVIISGLIISLLLFFLIRALIKTNIQAFKIADKLTKEIKQKEQRINNYINSTQDIVFILDTNQRHIEIYGDWPERVGLTKDFFLGKTAGEILGTGSSIHIQANERTLKGEKVIYQWNTQHNGKTVYYQTSLSPLFEGSKVVGLIGVGRDITELKEAEMALQKREEQLKQAQQIAKTGNWELDVVNKKLYWSDEVFRIFDCEPQEFEPTYDRFLSYIHPDDREKVDEAYVTHLQKRENYNIIHRIYSTKGELKYLKERCESLFDDKGNPLISLGTISDITEIMYIEKALLDSEERWKFALDGSQDGVWDWNLITNEVFFSKQWKTMLGFEEHEIQNNVEEWSKRVHPDDLQKCYSDIQLHLDGKTLFYSNTHRVKCKSGQYKWILDRGKIVSADESGKPLRMIGTHTDLTQRVEMEHQLIQLNEDKNKFIQVLAHDLRNPFSSLFGYAEILIDKIDVLDKPQIKGKIQSIYDVSLRTYNLLTDLLNWFRSQSGNLSFNPQKADVYTICQMSIENFDLAAKNKNISIKYLDKNPPLIMADENMVLSVLRNLLSNAIKFTKKDGTIMVYTETGQDFVTIVVSDSGVGIEKELQARIWDLAGLKSRFGTENEIGTGFGLQLCKNFVEKHGGTIWVESEPGKGSDFKFTIPVYKEA